MKHNIEFIYEDVKRISYDTWKEWEAVKGRNPSSLEEIALIETLTKQMISILSIKEQPETMQNNNNNINSTLSVLRMCRNDMEYIRESLWNTYYEKKDKKDYSNEVEHHQIMVLQKNIRLLTSHILHLTGKDENGNTQSPMHESSSEQGYGFFNRDEGNNGGY